MSYIYIAGSFPELSYAEISSVLKIFNISKDSLKYFSERVFLLESKTLTDDIALRIFNRLGGFTRLCKTIDNLDTFLDDFVEERVIFGISSFSFGIDSSKTERLSRDIKKFFKEKGQSVRFVLPKDSELNAAQIIRNKVIEKGFELCLMENANGMLYSKTLAIQNIDSFASRDSWKPGKDIEMGMLPTKLARIMCNLVGKEKGVIWDPFCGSGTILMEASMLGFNVLGSDIDTNALESSKKNLEWLAQEGYIGDILFNIFKFDVTRPEGSVLRDLKKTTIDAIVCEPFMGPPQKKLLSEYKAKYLIEDVKDLYKGLFNVLDGIAREGFRVVMVIPSYKTVNGWKTFGVGDIVDKRWKVVNKELCSKDLKWSRKNSIITRNILVLERK